MAIWAVRLLITGLPFAPVWHVSTHPFGAKQTVLDPGPTLSPVGLNITWQSLPPSQGENEGRNGFLHPSQFHGPQILQFSVLIDYWGKRLRCSLFTSYGFHLQTSYKWINKIYFLTNFFFYLLIMIRKFIYRRVPQTWGSMTMGAAADKWKWEFSNSSVEFRLCHHTAD